MRKIIYGLPFGDKHEEGMSEGYEHGRDSLPGITPRFRVRLGHGPETKDPLKRKAVGKGPWYFQGSVFDGKRWVVVAVGKLGDVATKIAEIVKPNLIIPKPEPAAAREHPDKTAERERKARVKMVKPSSRKRSKHNGS